MKTDRVRLEHILSACRDIIEMTTDGINDRKTELAVTKLIEIIGEASRHVSPKMKEKYPQIPWSQIIGMRNILIHKYFRISESHLQDTVFHRIPVLRDWIEGIIQTIEGQ